jgi:hypothetical protein
MCQIPLRNSLSMQQETSSIHDQRVGCAHSHQGCRINVSICIIERHCQGAQLPGGGVSCIMHNPATVGLCVGNGASG